MSETTTNVLVFVGFLLYFVSLGMLAYMATLLRRVGGWPTILTWGFLARELLLCALFAVTLATAAGLTNAAQRAAMRPFWFAAFLLLPLSNALVLGRWIVASKPEVKVEEPRDDRR